MLDFYQFQPRKQRKKGSKDFDTSFEFISSAAEYNHDPWNDLSKYIKRKPKTKLDDKIKKIRKEYTRQVCDIVIYNICKL